MNLLSVDTFTNTFGAKAQRKRPKLSCSSVDELSAIAIEKDDGYSSDKDANLIKNIDNPSGMTTEVSDKRMQAGQSSRIWRELYKVVDSSDVVIHVLDARDPVGTRCENIERYMKKEAPHKHLIFVLNKCDLVPTWVTVRIHFFLYYVNKLPHSSQDLVAMFLVLINQLRFYLPRSVTKVEY